MKGGTERERDRERELQHKNEIDRPVQLGLILVSFFCFAPLARGRSARSTTRSDLGGAPRGRQYPARHVVVDTLRSTSAHVILLHAHTQARPSPRAYPAAEATTSRPCRTSLLSCRPSRPSRSPRAARRPGPRWTRRASVGRIPGARHDRSPPPITTTQITTEVWRPLPLPPAPCPCAQGVRLPDRLLLLSRLELPRAAAVGRQ